MFKKYELPYSFDALEPHIDALTMETHYTKHHSAYTNNFNGALEKAENLDSLSIEEILGSLDKVADAALRTTLQNNGGGYYNHNLYFSIIAPGGQKSPQGALLRQIEADFGSFESMVEKVSALGAGRFGSGWAWLSKDSKGNLVASSTANQDNPLMEDGGLTPILGIDVWEHAYYLKYKNLRPDYIKAFWNVVDWAAVEKLYEKA